jgi:SAM-dependent methyltransferase
MKPRGALTAYDVAEHYDDAYFEDLARRYRERTRFARRRIANVFALLPHPLVGRFIDLGCGMGTFTIEAARAGAFAVGIDPAAAALTAATHVAHSEGVTSACFVRADAALLPIPAATTDVVLAADLIEHLDDDTLARVLDEAHRILRPGGTLVIYTPAGSHLFERMKDAGFLLKQDPSHIGVRTPDALATAVRMHGFERLHVRFQPSHVPVMNVLERAFAPRVPLLRRRIGLVARKP